MEETSPWASRRKTIALVVIVSVLFSASFLLFLKFWYQTPNCSDGIMNGDEVGIDCGGSCIKVCSGEAVRPIVRWDPRLFEITPGLWSVLVYVENPNINLDATYLPYTFTIYDQNNEVLEERKGATVLPRNQTVGVFEGSITTLQDKTPKRAIFEIGGNITWKKNEKEKESITITHSPLLRENSTPRVEVSVRNNEIYEIKNVEMILTIFDGRDNAVAASRTLVETIKSNESVNTFFTWPRPFDLGTKVCEKPSRIMLLLDRSGSMASISKDPVEPLTSAKEAAISFLEQLNTKDRAGVVSFASNASSPVDSSISSDLAAVKEAIGSIKIASDGTQYTNIYEAIRAAWQQFASLEDSSSEKVAILLTDGVANNPRDPSGSTEDDDIKYAENAALQEALNAKKDGVVIYSIGLGNQINSSFLKNLATSPDNYFFAPTAEDLEKIYKEISSDICKEVPARIEVTYRIFGPSI